MNGALVTGERRALVEAVRDFARRECGTREQRERWTDGHADSHSPVLFAMLAQLGWLGVTIPEAYGGGGGTVVDACMLLEELEHGRVPVLATGVTLIVAATVEKFGSPAQRERVLGAIGAGAPKAIAMSEPDAGSDVGGLRAAARRANGGWVLDGQKTWITAAHHADEIVVVARTDREAAKHEGLSMFLVPVEAPGIEIRPIPTMGAREVNDVFLAEVELPAEALLGGEGAAWGQLMNGLSFERLIAAAWMIGLARRAFDDTLEYVKARHQFGRPVGSFQALKHRLVDLATEIECARLLVYDVAGRVEAEPESRWAPECSMAKLKASEIARRVALEGMQAMGGAGYATEYEMEQLVRKALPTTIYAGTSEIQREIIGRSLGL